MKKDKSEIRNPKSEVVWILLLILGFSLPLPAEARKADAGANAGEFLRFGTGARAPAMGDANTAAAEGVSSLHYNPAGLGRTSKNEIEAAYQELALDIGQGNLGIVWPRANGRSAWGLGLNYVNYGTTARTTITTTGGVVTSNSAGSFSGNDLSVGLSYGYWFDDNPQDGGWGIGMTAKVISSRLDNVSATAAAADFGLTYKSKRLPFEAGISVQNAGSDLKYDVATEELPFVVRGGVSYRFFNNKLRLSADVEKVRHEEAHFMGGGEYWIGNFLALRAGYDGRSDDIDDGLTLGLGARYENLSADYAYVPYGDIGENHRLGLRYEWGDDAE